MGFSLHVLCPKRAAYTPGASTGHCHLVVLPPGAEPVLECLECLADDLEDWKPPKIGKHVKNETKLMING